MVVNESEALVTDYTSYCYVQSVH